VSRAILHLLDTDICIYLLNGRAKIAEDRLRRLPRDQIGVAAITAAELRYGALHSARPRENLVRVETFLGPIARVPFDDLAAAHFARIKHELAARGRPIGVMDLLIAATCLAAGAALVTNNVREFSRVSSLEVENWMQ
jgi:tRNA(fMet)-specific endonuclease VapC